MQLQSPSLVEAGTSQQPLDCRVAQPRKKPVARRYRAIYPAQHLFVIPDLQLEVGLQRERDTAPETWEESVKFR